MVVNLESLPFVLATDESPEVNRLMPFDIGGVLAFAIAERDTMVPS